MMKQNIDQDKKQLNEEYDQLLLYTICEQYLDDSSEYEQLLKEAISSPHEFSVEHENKFEIALASISKKKRSHLRILRRIGIVAAVAVLLFSTSGLYLVSNANWEDLRNFFIRRMDTHTEIVLPENLGNEYREILRETGWDSVYYPSYLPNKFVLVDILAIEDACTLEFSDEMSTIVISQSPLQMGSFIYIDTEKSIITPISINGYEGEYITKGNSAIIHYKTEEFYIVVESVNVSKKKLVKVTESLKIIKMTK